VTTKLAIKKIIESMKGIDKVKKSVTIPSPRTQFENKLHRERDMRQEAMDMGAHQAKEYFEKGE